MAFQKEIKELDNNPDLFRNNPALRQRSSVRKSVRKSLMPGTKVSFGKGDK
jgi:hypothetical protein